MPFGGFARRHIAGLGRSFALRGTDRDLKFRYELFTERRWGGLFRLGPAFRFLAEHQQLDADGRVIGYRNLSSIEERLR